MELEWVANDAKEVNEFTTVRMSNETSFEAINRHKKWRSQFIVGEPKASEKHSVEALKKMGLVGLYRMKSDKV